jgi:hypothetical protein
MAEADHNAATQIELGPGDGCVVIRADGACEMCMPVDDEDKDMSPNLVLLAAFALGMGVRDQRMIDVLAQIMEERRTDTGAN